MMSQNYKQTATWNSICQTHLPTANHGDLQHSISAGYDLRSNSV